MTTINRPQSVTQTQSVFSLNEMVEYLEKKFAIDGFDMNKSKNHFLDWCLKNGYEGNEEISLTQESVWTEAYKKAADGYHAADEILCIFNAIYNVQRNALNGKEQLDLDLLREYSDEEVFQNYISMIESEFGSSIFVEH